jgi:hypothetical protein
MDLRSTEPHGFVARVLGGRAAEKFVVSRDGSLAVTGDLASRARPIPGSRPAPARALAQRRRVELGVISRRHRVSLEPRVGAEAVRCSDSDHEVSPPTMCCLPSLQHDRVDETAFMRAAKGAANAPLGLHRERGRGRGRESRTEAPSGEGNARAARRPNRPPGGTQICGMEAAHRRQFSGHRTGRRKVEALASGSGGRVSIGRVFRFGAPALPQR